MSKTILMCPYEGSLAHVGRCLLIGQALRAIGHRVLFAGGGPYLELAGRAGFEVHPLVITDVAALARSTRQIFPGVDSGVEKRLATYVQDELRLYRELKPDLVFQGARVSVSISARAAGLPVVSVTNAYVTAESVVPFRVLPPLLHLFLEPLRRYLTLRPYNVLRRRYGVRPVRIREQMYDADLVLLSDAPEYAPLRSMPAHFRYIGPLIWEPDLPWPADLDAFLAGRNAPVSSSGGSAGRPVIYFTLGSTGLVEVFHGIVEQLRDTRYLVVITTARQIAPADLGPLPENCYAAAFLPGNRMSQRSDLVICQSGNGTIYQALQSGVPIIGIPTHVEQGWNGWLVRRHGVGLTIPPSRLQEIRPVIEHVLGTPRYRESAARMQQSLSRYEAPRTAAQLIDELLHQAT